MACFGSPISTSVAWPVEGAPQDVPLHRVGVLELVDQHHPVAVAQPLAAAAALRVGQRVGEPGQHVVVAVAAAGARLRRVHLGADGRGEPLPRPRPCCRRRRRRAPAGPAGRRPRAGRSSAPSARSNAGGRRRGRGVLAHVEVVDHLGDRSSTSSTNTASGSLSPATPSPASICWQNWWVVAIVAASKSASAGASRSRRRSTSRRSAVGQQREHRVVPSGGRPGRPAPRSAATSRSRTRSRSSGWRRGRT